MRNASLRSKVVARAAELGAIAVRFTSAHADDGTNRRLREAYARGDFETWNYSDGYAHAASSPQSLLHGARSVICVAVPYATKEPRRPPLSGRVSNYAWSSDYHQRMRELLRDLAGILDAQAGAAVCAIACDTAPLAERAFAARAGLGWIGKHTNLIAPKLGSFVFLGEIVTTLDFEEDAPLKKTCGSCTKCIAACPTAALRGDYTIDATKCIADLTQRTDSIPREMRALMGDWVWGCDICQLVCPPTRRAQPVVDGANAALNEDLAAPALQKMLRMRSSAFKKVYRKSALGWRGAAVLRRNAAVGLGNALDRSAVPVLIEALECDPHPLVREHAAWALARIGSPAALAALESHGNRETDPRVCSEIAAGLEPYKKTNR